MGIHFRPDAWRTDVRYLNTWRREARCEELRFEKYQYIVQLVRGATFKAVSVAYDIPLTCGSTRLARHWP